MSESKLTPRHVAIIMDGNGRWAQLRGRERYYGHMQGVEPVRAAVRAAIRRGVHYLTLYAFSTENWGRPAEEIDALMELFCRSVASETPELRKQGVRIAMIGDRSRFPAKVQEYLAQAERETAGGERLTLILALNYSSRSELVRAVRLLAGRVAAGELPAEAIDEQTVGSALVPAGRCGSATSCCGSPPTPNFISPTCCGPISRRPTSTVRWRSSHDATAVSD